MKIGICDDLSEERKRMKNYCTNLGYDNIILFESGEELLESKELSSLNLLFLDIEMKSVNGIEVKNTLELTNPSTFIVFCTTHQELIQNAFGRNVIFFLNKPFSEMDMEHCINKAKYLGAEYYSISIDEKTSILCKDIIYLHSEYKYTIFYTTDGESYSSRKSIKDWEQELKNLGFCMISRSTIINLKYYKKIQNKQVLMRDGVSLPISRRYTEHLIDSHDTYMVNRMR